MKILVLADEEVASLWDYYRPGRLDPYKLILSCGDLKSDYLSFIVTMAHCPVFYVHGNHDTGYTRRPPEGCDCAEDRLVVYRGLRILGLGGCLQYRPGEHQYSERQMARRIRKLKSAIKLAGGVDIVLTHAAPRGAGDWDDRAHRGFQCFRKLLEEHHPAYLLHGHVHLSYDHKIEPEHEYAGCKVINCCGSRELDIPDPPAFPPLSWAKKLWAKLFVRSLVIM